MSATAWSAASSTSSTSVMRPRFRVLGEALPHPDTDRSDAPTLAAISQPVSERAEDARTGSAERVSDGNGSTPCVDDVVVHSPTRRCRRATERRKPRSVRRHRHRTMRSEPAPAPCSPPRSGRSRSSVGTFACSPRPPSGSQARKRNCGRCIFSEHARADQHGCRAVVQRRGIASGDGPFGAEPRARVRASLSRSSIRAHGLVAERPESRQEETSRRGRRRSPTPTRHALDGGGEGCGELVLPFAGDSKAD